MIVHRHFHYMQLYYLTPVFYACISGILWSPWYNRNGWLGVKHQITYLLGYYVTDVMLHCAWSSFLKLLQAHNKENKYYIPGGNWMLNKSMDNSSGWTVPEGRIVWPDLPSVAQSVESEVTHYFKRGRMQPIKWIKDVYTETTARSYLLTYQQRENEWGLPEAPWNTEKSRLNI